MKKKFSGNNLPRQKLNLNFNNGNDSNKLSVNSLKAMIKYNNSNNNFTFYISKLLSNEKFSIKKITICKFSI
jgi:hypothetical protein